MGTHQISMIEKWFTNFRCCTSTSDTKLSGGPIKYTTCKIIEKTHVGSLKNKSQRDCGSYMHSTSLILFDFKRQLTNEKVIRKMGAASVQS